MSDANELTYDEAAMALYANKCGQRIKPSNEELAKIRRNLFGDFQDVDVSNDDDANDGYINNGDADDESSDVE